MAPPRKYSPELRERAVAMVFELREQSGGKAGAIARVAGQLGINRETVRTRYGTKEATTGWSSARGYYLPTSRSRVIRIPSS